jgi:acyl-CoA thioester hydrolase
MALSKRHHPDIAGPTNERPPFRFSALTRVAFSDTDAQGIVYYGRYAPYFDVARVEYWRDMEMTAHEAPHVDPSDTPQGGEFVMRAFNIEYHAPATFDDVLEVFCRVAKLGRTSVTFEFAVVYRCEDDPEQDRLLATATQTMVNVDLAERKPVPIDDAVRTKIEAFEQH